jgi:hypothetical protein
MGRECEIVAYRVAGSLREKAAGSPSGAMNPYGLSWLPTSATFGGTE